LGIERTQAQIRPPDDSGSDLRGPDRGDGYGVRESFPARPATTAAWQQRGLASSNSPCGA